MKCTAKRISVTALWNAIDCSSKKAVRTMVSDFGFSKVVYLSHPYGGEKSNAEELMMCRRMLTEMYPDWLIIDPIAAFGQLYYVTGYKQGLNMTMFLLSMLADEMIICSDKYRESKGCMAEIEFCKKYNIPITYTTVDDIEEEYQIFNNLLEEE